MYAVLLEAGAERSLRRLDAVVFRRVVAALRILADNPRPAGCRKLTARGGWRIRVGDYRVVYDVDDQQQAVTVLHVGHRRDVYR